MIRTPAGRSLMDVLVPTELFPTWSDVERARAIEGLLTSACDARSCRRGEAARVILGLNPENYDLSLTARRHEAGSIVESSGETFERRHEDQVLEEVAFEAILLAAELPYLESPQLRLQLVG